MHNNSNSSNKTLLILSAIVLLGAGAVAFLIWGDDMRTGDETTTEVATEQSASVSETYLDSEEVVQISTTSEDATEETEMKPLEKTGVKYIEVAESCNYAWEGVCVVARSGPSATAATTTRLRQGMVLRVDGEVDNESTTWYRLSFDDQELEYPERIKGDWFVNGSEVEVLYNEGTKRSWEDEVPTTTNKRIVVDKSEQMLYAYEGDELFLETAVSTGLELSPTSLGEFTVFKKMPSRYMQGPLPGVSASDYYDLSGVPWNLYFTADGQVIHGTYWHDSFGQQYSHGCINLPTTVAKELYFWAPLTTTVVVQN